MEEWRPVTFESYGHLYEVSSQGRVKSLRRIAGKSGGILAGHPNTCGYPSVQLQNNGKKKTVTVHILVARAFLGDPVGNVEVDHIDRNKKNNIVSNLRYVTHRQNQQNHPKYFKRKSSEHTSRYVGVHWFKRNKKWGASIQADSKRRFLGLFSDEQDAARAYDAAALELRGEHARLNFEERKRNE